MSENIQQRLIGTLKNYIEDLKAFNSSKGEEIEGWIKEVESKNIIFSKLKNMVMNLSIYYGPKDREYAKYLNNLIEGD